MNEENWLKLKEHAKKQHIQYDKLKTSIGRLGAHIWKDVTNKMWSLEKKK